jgi:hypothetical protein
MSNIANQSPYLIASRLFPEDTKQLSEELNKSYLDSANAINTRTIGIFAKGNSVITGQTWFLQGGNQKQQVLRQVYTFTAAGNIPHDLQTSAISSFTPMCAGEFTDGTNWYGAMFGSNVAIAGQVSFYVTPTNIVVLSGAGAPSIVSGIIVLEWISAI